MDCDIEQNGEGGRFFFLKNQNKMFNYKNYICIGTIHIRKSMLLFSLFNGSLLVVVEFFFLRLWFGNIVPPFSFAKLLLTTKK